MLRRRRTKIIATLGPATDDPQVLNDILAAGTNLVRINCSHGYCADHQQRVVAVRDAATALQQEIGVIADLQGPKIRVGKFSQGKIELVPGATFRLDVNHDLEQGNQHVVGITYRDLPKDVNVDDVLLLNEGLLELVVTAVSESTIDTEVKVGGELSSSKGINRLGGGLSAGALTEKDHQDIQAAVKMNVDYIAVSFTRNAQDILQTRQLIQEAGGHQGIIAKIERQEAIDNIEEIILASDAVMVARGDLGIEISAVEVPAAQKMIIHLARTLDRAVITATQMMESMIHCPVPTRAEVSDVANAVLDGTDAVMLSAETAVGRYPVKTVATMSEICQSAEKNPTTQTSNHRLETTFQHVDEAIAMASMYTANHLAIRGIIALSESGSTPLWMSRIRSGIPIYGLSRHVDSQRRMTLYRGVYPIAFDPTNLERKAVNRAAVEQLKQLGLVDDGDLVIITKGNYMGQMGGTNAMKIVKVGEVE